MESAEFSDARVAALSPRARPYELRDPRTPGLVVRVEHSGVRSWYHVFTRPDGRRARLRLGRTQTLSLSAARQAVKANAGDLAREVDIAARRKVQRHEAKRELTRRKRERQAILRTFLDDVYEPWAKAHQKQGATNAQRVRRAFEKMLDEPMPSITSWRAQLWRQQRLKDGRSAAGINRDITQLKSVLSRAVQCGLLEANPLAGLTPLRIDKVGVVRSLTKAEEVRLRAALDARDDEARAARNRFNLHLIDRGKPPLPALGQYSDHLTPVVLLALNTGMRRGEILSLRWRAVDLERRRVTVEGRTSKSLQTRNIPLNKEASEVLARWESSHPNAAADDLVFAGSNGEPMRQFQTSWENVRLAAKIERFRFHDLRHTFASYLVEHGVDLYRVKELLGHADIKMTMRYSHIRDVDLANAVALLVPADRAAIAVTG